SFKTTYRNVDVLLIDDIQFLAGKDRTLEEFFHTFNALHNNNKQVVITSDQPPKLLAGFEDRMKSRFEWGLLTDIQPPELETRIAILRKKALSDSLSAPDDALEYIASKISSNIRELEGALTRVTARQIAMYLCRELTDMSLPKIGQELGGRDHTTVIHADRKIRELMAERRAIYNQVTELTNRIKQRQREG